MRRFQSWVQERQYSNHLSNLIRIKHRKVQYLQQTKRSYSVNNQNFINRNIMKVKNIIPDNYKQKDNFNNRSKVQNLSKKQKINHQSFNQKKQSVWGTVQQSKQNKEESFQLINKLLKSKTIGILKQYPQSLKRYHNILVKFKPSPKNILKEQKFQQYLNITNEKFFPPHKFLVKITIHSISQQVPKLNGFHIMGQLQTVNEKVNSDYVQTKSSSQYIFSYPLKKKPPTLGHLKIFLIKGLNSNMIGQYQLNIPSQLEKITKIVPDLLHKGASIKYQIETFKAKSNQLKKISKISQKIASIM